MQGVTDSWCVVQTPSTWLQIAEINKSPPQLATQGRMNGCLDSPISSQSCQIIRATRSGASTLDCPPSKAKETLQNFLKMSITDEGSVLLMCVTWLAGSGMLTLCQMLSWGRLQIARPGQLALSTIWHTLGSAF